MTMLIVGLIPVAKAGATRGQPDWFCALQVAVLRTDIEDESWLSM
jgi:hypothetical protein